MGYDGDNFHSAFHSARATAERETALGAASSLTTTSRRSFLRIAGLAGVSLSLASSMARADDAIGFWSMDLSDEKLTDMFATILRIRWHERTMADKMLSDPDYFYAGQEAVAAEGQ